jgi:hypothetical protein
MCGAGAGLHILPAIVGAGGVYAYVKNKKKKKKKKKSRVWKR